MTVPKFPTGGKWDSLSSFFPKEIHITILFRIVKSFTICDSEARGTKDEMSHDVHPVSGSFNQKGWCSPRGQMLVILEFLLKRIPLEFQMLKTPAFLWTLAPGQTILGLNQDQGEYI